MPVRVTPSTHTANPIKRKFAQNELQVLWATCRDDYSQRLNILQSSFSESTFPPAMLSSENGLVDSIIQAYSSHHHLVLRPEDIWFSILSQINIYINAHSEALRDKFVQHAGKKELEIKDIGDRFSVDYGKFARQMTQLLDDNILDKEYREWIMPRFSTSALKDEVVASIIMMASMQKYFDYKLCLLCGLPSVTLLGEKSDYEQILQKLDKLPSLGREPAQFADVLRPVIKRMIRTFEDPQDESVISFWQRILDVERNGSGSSWYTGWVTAFCFWDEDGKCLYRFTDYDERQEFSDSGPFGDRVEVRNEMTFRRHEQLHLMLDGVRYHGIGSNNIPPGWSKVPVTVDDNGVIIKTEMIAGSVGISCAASGDETEEGKIDLDTMQPETGWYIYEKLKSDD